MSRNQIVFFLIIGIAIAIVVFGVVAQGLGGDENGNGENGDNVEVQRTPTPGSTLTLEVAVTPMVEHWLREAVNRYNSSNPVVDGRPVRIDLVLQESLAVWSGGAPVWTAADHPLIWIPEAGYVIEYASGSGVSLPFEIMEPSIAQTPIIWGGFRSRTDILGTLNGDTVQSAAVAEDWEELGGNTRWRFVKLAFPRPDSYGSGLAALLTLAADFAENPTLEANLMSDSALRDWLEPIVNAVPNFSTLGQDPAQILATRGTSTADFGLLPESQWLMHYAELNRIEIEPVVLFYPSRYFLLDFPVAIWSGSGITDDEREAAEDFAAFLLSAEQQQSAGEHGLRPVQGGDLSLYTPFSTAAEVIEPELSGTVINLPERAAVLNLLRWFSSYRTAS